MTHFRHLIFCGCLSCSTIGSTEGRWSGTCTVELNATSNAVDFDLTVVSDERTQIEGYGLFDYLGASYVGDVRGERFDSEVQLTVDGDNGDGFVRLEVVGSLLDEQIIGACAMFGVDGVLDMARTGSM